MKRFLLFAWIILSMSFACTRFEEPVEPIFSEVQTRAVIGSTTNNPYSLKNVRKAMNELSVIYGTRPTYLRDSRIRAFYGQRYHSICYPTR